LEKVSHPKEQETVKEKRKTQNEKQQKTANRQEQKQP
jgi:hypothetical protein